MSRGRSGALGAALLAAALTACATSGSKGGGAENLPNRGIVPWTPVDFLRGLRLSSFLFPPALQPDMPGVTDPSALVTDEGVVLFAAVTLDGESFVGRNASANGLDFGVWAVALAAPDARAPAVTRDPDTGRWHMVFRRDGDPETPPAERPTGEAPGLYRADSDDGLTFREVGGGPWLVALGDDEAGGLGPASLVVRDAVAHVFYEARGLVPAEEPAAAPEPGPAVIRHAAVPLAGGPFGPRRTVLRGGVECTDVHGEAKACWDAQGVGDPEVRLARSAACREIWRLFYVGYAGETSSLGFAAAFAPDADFARYAYNPVLTASKPRTAPSNVMAGARYLLYYVQPGRLPGVGVAEDAVGVPSEVF